MTEPRAARPALDLEAIKARWSGDIAIGAGDIPALLAEVEALRDGIKTYGDLNEDYARKLVCDYHMQDKGEPGEPCGKCLTCLQAEVQVLRAERDEKASEARHTSKGLLEYMHRLDAADAVLREIALGRIGADGDNGWICAARLSGLARAALAAKEPAK